jgi:hypothetical protein
MTIILNYPGADVADCPQKFKKRCLAAHIVECVTGLALPVGPLLPGGGMNMGQL